MSDSASVILKVLLGSALISVAIKYGLGQLPITGSSEVALGMVVVPVVVLAIALTWRSKQSA